MNLKNIYLILLFILSLNIHAQGERLREKKEQIKAMKVAFLTSELDLTSNEAEKFWPIYNTFDEKQFELRHQKMKGYFKRMEEDELNKLSEKDAAILLNQIESNEEDLFNLRKKFIISLKGILPSVKIIKLRKAEEGFNRKLLQQYRDKAPKR
jgi:hypothetical protein